MVTWSRLWLLVLWTSGFLLTKSESPPAANQLPALMDAKLRLDSRGNVLRSWNESNPCSEWKGLTCDSVTGEVIGLELRGAALRGSIPPILGNLTSLQLLDLSENNFTGPIPPSYNALVNLTQLSLCCNSLNSSIPSNLSRRLLTINLESNQLSGSIETVFIQHRSLQRVVLGGNDFSGGFPQFGNPDSLVLVSLKNNSLTGDVPSALLARSATNLTLELSGNPLCANASQNSLLASSCGSLPSNESQASAFCRNASCPAKGYPNPYLYNLTLACVCSEPATINLLLSTPPFNTLTAALRTLMEQRLGVILDINAKQVEVLSVKATNSRQLLVEINLFPNGTEWSLAMLEPKLDSLENKTDLGPRNFGPVTLLSRVLPSSLQGSSNGSSPTTPAIEDPAEPPPPSGSPSTSGDDDGGGLRTWHIVFIAAGAGALLLVLFLVSRARWQRYRRPPTPPPPEALSARESLQRTGSEFELKVQQHFVKAITFSEIQAATENFSKANLLGEGSYGTVYKGVDSNQQEWAVKRAKQLSVSGLKAFQNEVDVISKMSHRNLVRLLGFCTEQREQILVYEYVPKGTLRQNLDLQPGVPVLSFNDRLEIAIGAAQGLYYLHSFAKPTIIHRDIKSENILLDNMLQAKVADFGLLKNMQSGAGGAASTRIAGTPGYIDPEAFETLKPTSKSDVYSFGVVLLELMTGRKPILDEISKEDESYRVTLVEWALPLIEAGEMDSLVDPAFEGNFDVEGMKIFGHIAAMCTKQSAKARPEMSEVTWRLAETKNKVLGTPSTQSLETLMKSFSFNKGLELRSSALPLAGPQSTLLVNSYVAGLGPGTGNIGDDGQTNRVLSGATLPGADFFGPRRQVGQYNELEHYSSEMRGSLEVAGASRTVPFPR